MSKFITIIRPDFMDFCGDACRAAALNHLLFRIAGKSKDQPKELIKRGDILWYATTGQIVEEMSHAWGDCKVRKEVNALINMGIIGRRSNPAWGADRTKHFCFGQKECKKFLALCQKYHICVMHLGMPPEVVHLIYLANANDTSIKCICSIHQMEPLHLSDANDTSIRAIPIDSPTIEGHSIDDYKEERAALPESTENARALSENENNTHSYRHDHTRKEDAWRCEAWCHAHDLTCEDYQAWIERGGRDEPTDPGIPVINAPVAIASTSGEPDTSPLSAQTRQSLPIPQKGDVLAVLMQDGKSLALAQVEHFEDKQHIRVNWLEPCGQYVQAWRDTGGGISHPCESTLPARPDPGFTNHGIQAFGDYRVLSTTERAAITVKSIYLRLDTQHTSPSQGPTDGAATDGGSEPRASGMTWQSALDDWDAVQGRPYSRTDRMIKAAKEAVVANPTRDELRGCRDWLPTTDNPKDPWYKRRGVAYWDVIEKLGAYRSHLALSIQPAPLADVPKPKPLDVYAANSMDKEKMDKRIEEMRARVAAKGIQLPGGVPPHGTN